MMHLAMDEETIALRNENRLGLHKTEGVLNYYLELFGDYIAEREGYRNLDGMEAIHFYLIHKFGWLPRDVKSMSLEDVKLVLSQEREEYQAKKTRETAIKAGQKAIKEILKDG